MIFCTHQGSCVLNMSIKH